MHLSGYSPEGALLSRCENREYLASESGLLRAMNEGVILEGVAIRCDEEYRLTVDLGCMLGVIDRTDVEYDRSGGSVRDIAVITRVGKAVCFKVVGFFYDNGIKKARLSRKEAQRECYEAFLDTSIPGDVIDAKITHLESFGAFVDVGCGIISLLSIDCISVSRISHPSDRFALGDRIKAVIKSYDGKRIYVTHKELLGTWEENASLFSVGQTVTGIVRSIEEYGIFVELTPNLAGLAEYRSDVTVGQRTAVYIKNIIPDRMKLKLVIIDSYKGETSQQKPITPELAPVQHISSWRYSPSGSQRIVETVFQ